MTLPVQPLTKVTIRFWQQQAGTTALTQVAGEAALLFGLGRQGLSEFEQQLDGRQPGERITLQLAIEQHESFWAQHLQPLQQVYGKELLAKDGLMVEIIRVVPAENREVVKALASGAGCGGHGHGGCGCGCS